MQGGDKVVLSDESYSYCGTITLRGVSIGNRQGFVTAAHLVGAGNTRYVVHDFDDINNNRQYFDPLSTVYSNPAVSDPARSDTLFVEYPKECGFEIPRLCLFERYLMPIDSLKIEGDSRIYRVVVRLILP